MTGGPGAGTSIMVPLVQNEQDLHAQLWQCVVACAPLHHCSHASCFKSEGLAGVHVCMLVHIEQALHSGCAQRDKLPPSLSHQNAQPAVGGGGAAVEDATARYRWSSMTGAMCPPGRDVLPAFYEYLARVS